MNTLLYRIERELKRPQLSPRQLWTRRMVATLLLLGLLAMVAEIALRAVGYVRPQIDPNRQKATLQASSDALNQRFSTDCFIPDPYLLWKLRPGGNLAGNTINPRGMIGTMNALPDRHGESKPVRVLCLGDSMTAVTYRTYPSTVQRLVNAAESGPDLQLLNGAVPGYSTEQGIRWLRQLGADLTPGVIVVCFGWNDHFPALNLPDRELGSANQSSRVAHKLLRDVRLYQFLIAPQGTTGHAASPLSVSGNRQDKHLPWDPANSTHTIELRVPPEQFAANLRTLVTMIRSNGSTPVLATQPENLTDTSQEHLKQAGFELDQRETQIALHRLYNTITRQVARESGVPLMDLEEEFLRRKREHLIDPDGIHLTGRGHNHVARLLLALLRDENKVSAADYDAIANAERHDTTAPDKPRASWTLIPEHLEVATTETLRFAVLAHNAGNTRWLRENLLPAFGNLKNLPYGNVFIEGVWRTKNSPTDSPPATIPIPSDILPGETTSVTLIMAPPRSPGNYEVQVGLRASGIGNLSQFGAETTTLTVTVR